MEYVKRAVRAVLFLSCLLGILVVSGFVFVPKDNTTEAGIEEWNPNGILGEKENTVDVIFLGDSEVYSAYIPTQIWKDAGYTSYACSSNSQKTDYSLVLLKRVLKTQSPKIVFIETNMLYSYLSRAQTVLTEASEYLPVLRYHDRWKSLTLRDFTEQPEYTYTLDTKGYRYYPKVAAADDSADEKEKENAEEISGINLHYLKKMIEMCRENNIKVVLISSPSALNWSYGRYEEISAIAEETGTEYVELNLMKDEVPIDWQTDTRDKGDHVNHAGAVKVTTYVTKYLQETGLLEDHKNDPDYAQWDESLKAFEKTVEESN